MNYKSFYIAGIGASAGGHDALEEFFRNIVHTAPVAYVVITHLLRDHTSVLDKIISRFSDLPVHRMKGFDLVLPGNIYVMPENVKVFIRQGALILKPRGEDEVINKNIDLFFHSLAEDQKEKAIGIVFSGLGTDGAEGVKTIHEFGGKVLVQEPHSSVFRSMPDAAIKRDSPDQILRPSELARYVSYMVEMEATPDYQQRENQG